MDKHTHDTDHGFWAEYIGLLTDPAHLLFEMTFTLLFDVVVIILLYGVVFKKYILPKIKKKVHDQIHEDHGLNADVECTPENTVVEDNQTAKDQERDNNHE